ncbi:YbaN family protein [Halovulum sp. GXIMD14794]
MPATESERTEGIRRTAGGRMLWTALGAAALVAGLIGAVLPVLPTAPFVILAAFAFGKGSPALRARLVAHKHFGPIIDDWERTGAIATKWKVFACTAMAVSFAGSVLILQLDPKLLVFQGACMLAAAAYILTRPSR